MDGGKIERTSRDSKTLGGEVILLKGGHDTSSKLTCYSPKQRSSACVYLFIYFSGKMTEEMEILRHTD